MGSLVHFLNCDCSILDCARGAEERRVLDALLAPKDGMRPTTLIVAHRLRAVAPAADRVVVFDNGSVVATGTHDELLASSQVYGELWRAKESLKGGASVV